MNIKPQVLKKGDTVGVIAPASPIETEKLLKGIDFLEKELRVKVKLGKSVSKQNGFLAGSDQERADDLHMMFSDEEVKAIFCACGGYGSARVASLVDYELIKRNPKIFWGYSDVSFLHTAIREKTGLVTFHGPMLGCDYAADGEQSASKESFYQLFEAKDVVYDETYSSLQSMSDGIASGELVGGNLMLLTTSLGTPFEINTKGKLLLIEDIGEEPHSVDRMLNHLHMTGKLDDAAGLLIGDFSYCDPRQQFTFTLDEVLEHYVRLANKPTLRGFKIGHCNPNIGVPLGTNATIDTSAKTLVIESGVRG